MPNGVQGADLKTKLSNSKLLIFNIPYSACTTRREQYESFVRPSRFRSVLANGFLFLVGASLPSFENRLKISIWNFAI